MKTFSNMGIFAMPELNGHIDHLIEVLDKPINNKEVACF